MKTHLIIKFVFSVCCFCFSLNLQAKTITKSINVETAGSLSTLISYYEKYNVTDLNLSGTINGKDILFLREMAGRDVIDTLTTGILANLDLSGVNIVGDSTIHYYQDPNNKKYYSIKNSIGDYSFYHCEGLKTIILPTSITSIGQNAFSYCKELKSITIPKSVASVGICAFTTCTKLAQFIVDENNPNLCSYEGVLFNKTKTLLISYPNAKTENYTIPNEVQAIEDYAFVDCFGLKSVTIPISVTSLGEAAFESCTGLTSINIPERVPKINIYSFNNCSGLTTLTLPKSVKSIEPCCFNDCTSLISLNLGDSLTTISDNCFNHCLGLTALTIPNSLTLIDWHSFMGCKNLKILTLGEKISFIYMLNFNICPKLSEIHFLSKLAPKNWDNGFIDVDKRKCKLFVPFGCFDSYKKDNFWGKFSTIIEKDSAIIYLESESITITAYESGIHFQIQEAIPVIVYSLSGTKVFDKTVTNDVVVYLNKGFYLVKIPGKTMKIIVK